MKHLDLSELTALLRECAGQEEGVDLDGDVLDTPFTDLGYDSLAMLQTTGRIERDYEVTLDGIVDGAGTPHAYLDAVNRALAAQEAA
ncbi:acyl carrier protein [Streptomyces sp. LP11]|uniref:Acyl carrier protein n=1 Tax=Streptomyces pyxinicus TaxID=2970331 RepID=A0ABT2B1F5_9ACTN|nr:acyl carrier protein [Streptomyces sp. LP11]MCS0602255.1 acyl carrier protein [Streptomyces sp. LP11]